MAGGFGDAIEERSVFDSEEGESWYAPGGDDGAIGGNLTHRPDSYRKWLNRVDWLTALPAVTAAERAMTRLWASLHSQDLSRTRGPWRERAILDEAVHQIGIEGWRTTRLRVRAAIQGYEIGQISTDDKSAVIRQSALKKLYANGVPEDAGGQKLLEVGLHLSSLSTSEITDHIEGDDAEASTADKRLAERLEEVLSEASTLSDLPSTVVAAAIIWRISTLDPQEFAEPGRLCRSLVPVFLRIGATQPPPPLVFISRALSDQPTRWQPRGDPTGWILRFSECLQRACGLALGDLALMEHRVREIDKKIGGSKKERQLRQAAYALVSHEILSSNLLRRALSWEINDRWSRMLLNKLSRKPPENGLGLAREVTGKGLYRVYVWHDVPRSDFQRPEREVVYREHASAGEPTPAKSTLEPTPLDRGASWAETDKTLKELYADLDQSRERALAAADKAVQGPKENNPEEWGDEDDF